ncbi:sialate O-acetylesterase [Janthinobacterium sp. YR213]|uniref:sialate O-acetylesterase n=1 Tax=Janthinobacterium sp. YR213 TaxID=1881027 RepID=UPI0011136714|nr:sialate O-acetylesterase [Janthinobacterium sp. YR213]
MWPHPHICDGNLTHSHAVRVKCCIFLCTSAEVIVLMCTCQSGSYAGLMMLQRERGAQEARQVVAISLLVLQEKQICCSTYIILRAIAINSCEITKFMKIFIVFFSALILTACGGGGAGNPAPIAPITPIVNVPLEEMKILIIGQSISSNCNEYVYGAVDNVFQIGKDGSLKAARDPFEWADCGKGAMWMPLGKKLIEAGIARKVVFMPIGVAGSRVEDWQVGGAAFGKLTNAITLMQAQGLSFDFAFWHQGSSNAGTDKTVYAERLRSVLDYVNSKVKIKRWLIAVHSRCSGTYDSGIESAQILVGNAPQLNRYPGPNTNLLGNEYRYDTCHLNQKGQEKMASMWLESVSAVPR